jgi:hypothetical protein
MCFPDHAFTFTGTARQMTNVAANGNIALRNFCPKCGGLVFGGTPGKDAQINVYAGSLDRPEAFEPTIAIFTRGKPAWATIPSYLKVYERAPV